MSAPEHFTDPIADRAPTPDEERVAERNAKNVDLDDVTSHEEEANRIGANVKGEGEIEPG